MKLIKYEIDPSKFSKKQLEEAELWAKGACDRIFSHYSKQEMIEMRKRNADS